MRTFTETLEAGKRVRLPCNGFNFNLFSSSSPLNLNFITQGKGETGDICNDIVSGFWYESPTLLTFVEMTSTVNQVVQWSVSNGRAGYTRISGEVSANIVRATVIGQVAPVAVGVVAVSVIASNAARKRVIFTADENNTGTLYLGAVGVTVANSAIVLASGESYIEELASPVQFYGVSDLAGQIVRISEAL